jgi:hypothetical protein
MYAINTLSKCRNFPVPWLFENYSTRLPEKKQQCWFNFIATNYQSLKKITKNKVKKFQSKSENLLITLLN